MTILHSSQLRVALRCCLISGLLILSQAAQAESWQATVGAQSPDEGMQALAFLPNEMWIHAGDSITWTFPTPEPHSVTFLKESPAEQVRPPRPGIPVVGGCPG